jgi:galactokinase
MAGKAKTENVVATNYRARITKSSDAVAAEQVDLTIDKAENFFQQGLLSLKSQMIDKQGDLKSAEIAVKEAHRAIENAKSAKPENLVQALINAKTAELQANINMAAAQEAYDQLQAMYSFIEETGKELF